MEIGRNDPCHCGSGKKYKKCHLEKDEMKDQKKRQEAALNAAKVAAEKEKEGKADQAGENKQEESRQPQKGWFQKMVGKVNFIKTPSQRRIPPQNKGG